MSKIDAVTLELSHFESGMHSVNLPRILDQDGWNAGGRCWARKSPLKRNIHETDNGGDILLGAGFAWNKARLNARYREDDNESGN